MSSNPLHAVTGVSEPYAGNDSGMWKNGDRLNLLFISNFYPPLDSGGYPQLCWEIAQALRQRGHRVAVISSSPQRQKAQLEEKVLSREPAAEPIYRMLHLECDLNYYRPLDFFLNWKRRRDENLAMLGKVMDEIRPDVTLIWSLWGLSKSIAALVEARMPSRTAYYLAGYWPTGEDLHSVYWRKPARHPITRGLKRVGSYFARQQLESNNHVKLKFANVMCVSAALREKLVGKGLPLENARIVHNGIDIEQFAQRRRPDHRCDQTRKLRLLYAGQLAYHKGVHTAVEAIDILVNQLNVKDIHLTILGNGHPEYEAYLHRAVAESKLVGYIGFHDRIPRDQLPGLLSGFDALVLPSIYEEPLARIAQEAMAAGLVVVATSTGGTRELLREGENGLVFTPGDPRELAHKIAILSRDEETAERMRSAGRKTIVEHFNIDRAADEVEAYLVELAGQAGKEP
jgi:glycosyltransferase involved in cell wall biosynthesis